MTGIPVDGDVAAEMAARWERIMAAVADDEGRKDLVRVALQAFSNAQCAYNAAYNGGPEGGGIVRAGMFAWLYLDNFEYIRNTLMGGATPKEAIDKLQAVSDWLAKMGWRGLPSAAYVGLQEVELGKTAAGVHTDMLRYRESGDRVRAAGADARAG